MATVAAAIDQAAHPKSVDESLWWDSFVHLFNDLESASLSTELPSSLVKKLKNNHAWFLDTVSLFKPPNQKSRAALDCHQIVAGPHRLIVQPKLKDLALQISSSLGLDEVQSYILVIRSVESENFVEDIKVQEFLHLISLQYYIERQCLLKCTRQIIMHASYIGNGSEEGDAIGEEALKLLSDGLDRKLLSVIRNLLSSKHLEHMEVDLATLWAEEILIEDNLVLDIFFLAYYESFCTCNGEQWRSLCLLYKEILSGSFNFGKLAISVEARNLFNHSKVQLLLILIETLDLENLLQMVHDEVPFRQGHSVFTLMDIQDMDAMISSFNAFEMEEAAPLILAWAIFLCLLTSLPEKQENNVLAEIDHVGYVRQAFKAAPLSYVLKILENDILKDSDAPTTGHRSVLRTFVSAFIASYEITLQLEDGTLNLILDILCKIYRGEEALCVRFWDRESVIDGPIRCLLCTLEGEFPFRTVELVRFLSALGEGTWPAECVYNFLDKAVGISSLFEVSGDTCMENTSEIETHQPLNVPGVEDLLIPSQTRGHVLKVIDGNTVLVRWEYTQSGVIVLLLRLAQRLHLNYYEETLFTLDLLCRLVSFSPTVCFALMGPISFHVQTAHMNGHVEQSMRVDVIEIICTLVRNLSSNVNAAAVMSMSISILANMLKCFPSHVIAVVLKKDIFEVALNTNNFDVASNRSGMWLLSGGLARILLIDCELAVDCCPLTISVLDFTMQLVETGAEDDIVLALVVFSLQYVFVNHEHWKYKMKHVRWKVTMKVLEVMKKCIMSIPISQKLGSIVRDILLCDSSVHNTLCRIMCITSTTLEKLYVSRLYEVEEIEGLHTAVCAVLDIVFTTLSTFSKDDMSSLPGFHQAMLSSSTKPIPVVTAVISLISYFRDPAIQVGAAKVLSMLCIIAENAQPYLFGDVCLVSDEMQISDLRYSIYNILCEETPRNEDLFIAIVKLLTCAARYQPAFLVSMIATKETMEVPLKQQPEVSFGPLRSKKVSLIDALLQYVKRSSDLIERHPHLLLNMLIFLKVLWQGATQYVQILELLKTTEMFWKQLSSSISSIATKKSPSLDNQTEDETRHLAYKYQCHSAILEIMAYDMFLEKKLQEVEFPSKQTSEPSKERIENKATLEKSKPANRTDLKNILSAWCESSVMGDLIKSYVSCRYDEKIFLRAKIAASSFLVHVMGKLTIGDAGSMSLSLIEKIQNMSKKLRETPAFSELLGQYSLHGYSVGKELNILILSDLYYHIQGELEGREINPGPFKELTRCLHELNFSQTDEHKYNRDFPTDPNDVYLFDLVRLRADLGLQFWDHSEWKASKAIAKRMLLYMQDANLMAFLAHSKLSALKALTTIVSVYEGNLTEIKTTSIGGWISESFVGSRIDHICKCLQTTVESLVPDADPCEDVISFLGAQSDLLLYLIRFLYRILSKKANRQRSLSVCTLVLKTSGAGLRMLSSIRPSIVGVRETMKLFLTLLLMSVEFCHSSSRIEGPDKETVEAFSEVSLLSLGLLPILCRCIEMNEYCTLSLATMDLILKGYLTSNTWLPIIQKHLQLQLVIQKLREKDSFHSISIVLKFLLSLARVRGGAEMLQSARFFSSLKVVFDILLDKKPFLNTQYESDLCSSLDKDEKSEHIWGLGLAVITAIIYSLGDSSSCVDIVDSIIPYFFCEKAYLMFYHLNAPDFPSEDHGKKRARTQKTQTSLTALRETGHTLMLMCVLAKHRNSWAKAMKEMDSQLREKSIHLLAFVSRGAQRIGESPSRTAPLVCPPMLKEEIELNRQHSLINSKRGWFSLSPLGCVSKSAVSCTALVPLIKDQTTENADSVLQTHFSDTVTIQLYRNAFLLLKFLCLQVKEAAKRAEDVGFIDLAHFPELPMPEILHGLQDQAIAIVTELCEANKSKQMQAEIQDVCFLLLNIMEMALYLELCVSQTCGIRPVLGRVEDFSKELKTLMQVIEEHTSFKLMLKSLRQIVSLVYPGLLQSEGL